MPKIMTFNGDAVAQSFPGSPDGDIYDQMLVDKEAEELEDEYDIDLD